MARFFDGERAAAHQVTPQPTADALLILAGDGTTIAEWPFRLIVAVHGAEEDGSTTLARRGEPARLVVDDAGLLDRLAAAGVRVGRARPWRLGRLAALVFGTFAALACAAILLDSAPRLVAPLVPQAWENHLGRLVETGLTQGHRTCTGAAGQQALETLVARLRVAGSIKTPVRIAVIDSPIVNALTLPGGRVLVMRGLIRRIDDGAELAGVIAHELGHVAHHDATTLMLRQLGIGFVMALLGWNDALGGVGEIAQNLATLSYSRRAEAAADAAAEAFLTRAGLRADGLGRFFARLEAIEGHGSIPLLASHPSTEQRRARATVSTAGTPPLSDAEWVAVRRMCD